MSKELLTEIKAAATELGIAPTTLCQRALRNTALPRRLATGGSVTIETAQRLRQWIAAAKAAASRGEAA